MHLYIHEFHNIDDNKIKDLRELLFNKSLEDYQERMGNTKKSLEVSKGKHGKPYFPSEKDLHFSISHSGKYWICMFDIEDVGVDIEDYSNKNMSLTRYIDISNRFFTEDEKKYVLGDLNEIQNQELDEGTKNRFFRIWTSKEAYMKYTGNGFSEGFRRFSVLDGSLDVYFRNVPIDQKTVLTFCSKRDTNLDELINF